MVKKPSDLTTSVLIKRVMSGKKEFRDPDYLEAFGKLSSSQLYGDQYEINHFEILKLWNSLQNTPNKTCYFTFSLVNQNVLVQKKIKECYAHAKYAWICHDKDKNAEHKHFHYVLMFPNAMSFASVANTLQLPVTMLEKVFSKKKILRYLTHEDDRNKHHYDISEITANFDVEAEQRASQELDTLELYDDYLKVGSGILSPRDFIIKYNTYFATLSIPSKLQVFSRLHEALSTGAGLSSRAECRLPNPCSTRKNISFATLNGGQPMLDSSLSRSQLKMLVDGKKVSFDVPLPPKKKSIGKYRKGNSRSDLNNDVA